MAITTAIVATKGGGTKTTTSLNLGGMLADCRQRTLLVDADPQGSLTKSVQYLARAQYGLTRTIQTGSAEDCISRTTIENLDIIENDDPEDSRGPVMAFLRESSANVLSLCDAVEGIQDLYDYILIDTQGTKHTQLHEAAILAADRLLTPIVPSALDAAEFGQGSLDMVNRLIPRGRRSLTIAGRPFPSWHALISRTRHTNSNRDIRDYIRQNLRQTVAETTGGAVHFDVLETTVPDRQVYMDCTALCEPVHRLEPRSQSKTLSAYDTMLNLMVELFPELKNAELAELREA